ncbi:MAG TPA: hypothetical protein VNY36_00595 [Bacteroidia bacterium]|nr:hypothetical protein [Bacteroidia bacterium]
MKRSILVFFFSCGSFSFSFGQSWFLQSGELNGNVKSVYVNEYHAKDSAGIIVKDGRLNSWSYYKISKKRQILVRAGNYDGNDFIKKEVYKYDNRGREVEDDLYMTDTINYPSVTFTKYNWRGKIVEQGYYFRYIPRYSETHLTDGDNKNRYTFNFFGKCKEAKYISYSERGDSTVTVSRCDYSSDNGKVKKNRIDTIWKSKDTYTIFYYCKGKDTCEINVYNGQITARTYKKYDKNGLWVERITRGVKDKSLNRKEIYKYDKSGNEIECSNYLNDTIPDSKILSKFNKKNEILLDERITYYKGSITEDHKQVYEYDDKWNLVKEVIYKNDTPNILIERTIAYY